jgi:hypothetical protein
MGLRITYEVILSRIYVLLSVRGGRRCYTYYVGIGRIYSRYVLRCIGRITLCVELSHMIGVTYDVYTASRTLVRISLLVA